MLAITTVVFAQEASTSTSTFVSPSAQLVFLKVLESVLKILLLAAPITVLWTYSSMEIATLYAIQSPATMITSLVLRPTAVSMVSSLMGTNASRVFTRAVYALLPLCV